MPIRSLLLMLPLIIPVGGCYDYCVMPEVYHPSSTSLVEIDQSITHYDFRNPDESSYRILVDASFRDKYVPSVLINSTPLTMKVRTRDTFNIVSYAGDFYKGQASFDCDGSFWRIAVAGSSAFPGFRDTVASPVQPVLSWPRATDTLSSEGFILRWIPSAGDSIRVRIRVNGMAVGFDAATLDRGELAIGRIDLIDSIPGVRPMEILLSRTRRSSHLLDDSSRVVVNITATEQTQVPFRR